MMNIFKKLKERLVDLTNYNKDEVIAEKSALEKELPPAHIDYKENTPESTGPSKKTDPLKNEDKKSFRKRENVSKVDAADLEVGSGKSRKWRSNNHKHRSSKQQQQSRKK